MIKDLGINEPTERKLWTKKINYGKNLLKYLIQAQEIRERGLIGNCRN